MLGVIGGLGPRATQEFYCVLMRLVAQHNGGRIPRVLLYNVAMSPVVENAYLNLVQNSSESMRPYVVGTLKTAVDCFLNNKVEKAVLPCNTLQTEFVDLCHAAGLDYIDMIANVIGKVVDSGIHSVLVLGTGNTRVQDVYGKRLLQHGIDCRYPSQSEQLWVERYIRSALDMSVDRHLRNQFVEAAKTMASGFDGAILACTDLCGDLDGDSLGLPVFDSLYLLAEASANYISKHQNLFMMHPQEGL